MTADSREQDNLRIDLAIINTKLDALLVQRDDHEIRLRGLEQFKWVLIGVALASGGVGGAVAQIIG